ncbi:hypothetical protein C8R43DRAFT_893785, partial [Mycena crocata]
KKFADDVHKFYDEMQQKNHCLFCRHQHATHPHMRATQYSLRTSTGVLRRHLFEHHADAWIAACDQMKISITAKDAQPVIEEYRRRQGQPTNESNNHSSNNKRSFSREAFVDAIVEFIVGDDQSINVIENEHLRAIFLMLRSDLKDSDIPHRTTIRNRIMELWDKHLDRLEAEIGVRELPSFFV